MIKKQTKQAVVHPISISTSSKKLVIAQIIGGLSVGGAEKQFVHLTNVFAASECHAFFVGKKQSGPTMYDQLSGNVLQTHQRIRKRSFVFGILALARELAKRKCDVVHTHMFWASVYGTIAARLARVPVVVTTEHGENRWKKAHHRWLEKHVISRFADIRYCVSREILARRRDVDGVPSGKLRLMANGTIVPPDPAQVWSNAVPVIGSVGRFVFQKNFRLFVDMISTLRNRGYTVRGCIVGDGPEMQDIRKRITELDLTTVIELPGLDTETSQWFLHFDIYAITSREEGLPVSLLEAMSYGLPVVATDVGDISSAIDSGAEGTIVPAGDKDRFVDAIAMYLDDQELAVRTGRRARERIEKDFSIDAISARYEFDYRAILERKESG